jgi:hypothetical protein
VIENKWQEIPCKEDFMSAAVTVTLVKILYGNPLPGYG